MSEYTITLIEQRLLEERLARQWRRNNADKAPVSPIDAMQPLDPAPEPSNPPPRPSEP